MMTEEIQALLAKALTDEATAREVRARFRRALDMILGRWKLDILWLLNQRMHRFGELRRKLSGVTQHMLTVQLRELEADGLIKRTIYAEVPPRVEYEITPYARTLRPVFFALVQWSQENPPRSMRKAADKDLAKKRLIKAAGT